MVDLTPFKQRICEAWQHLTTVDAVRDKDIATVSTIMSNAVFTQPVVAFDEAYGRFINQIGQDPNSYDSWLLFVINIATDLPDIDNMVEGLHQLVEKMGRQLEGMEQVTFNVKNEGLSFAVALAIRLYVPYTVLETADES